MKGHYTGVGSRQIPQSQEHFLEKLGAHLCYVGWILRSGHANGSDMAFERGSDSRTPTRKQIFLPWSGFNSAPKRDPLFHDRPPLEAFVIASRIHPAWNKCTDAVRKLHARNVLQVLGPDLKNPEPSRFLVCWTLDGEASGGTRTAIKVAEANNVPVFNRAKPEYVNLDLDEFVKAINGAL